MLAVTTNATHVLDKAPALGIKIADQIFVDQPQWLVRQTASQVAMMRS
jgi:hypothetical protein